MSLTFVPNKIQHKIYNIYLSIYLYKWSKMRMVMTYDSFEARDLKKKQIFMLRKRQFVSQLKHNAVYEFNFHDFKLI